MECFKNYRKRLDKEDFTVRVISKYISEKFEAKIKLIDVNANSYIWIFNKKFDVILTICNTDKVRCIKLEEILINKKYRNKGLGTDLLKSIMNIVKDNDCILGLWCYINNSKGFEYYKKLGFKHIDTKDDYWLEYK